MIIDHIGLAVRNLDEAIRHWELVFGYKQITEIVINSIQKVRVVFLEKKPSIDIKLIEPLDKSSPIYNFTMRGGGLHHLCFRCNNMQNTISKLTDKGLRVIVHPQPGEAFENENISFLFGKNGLNIELIDTEKRAKKL